MAEKSTITRVAVLYDGGYTQTVSFRYYNDPQFQSHLNYKGLHEYIRHRIADALDKDDLMVQVVEAHWFRGMLPPDVASEQQLRMDRTLETIFLNSGIEPHREVMRYNKDRSTMHEKGIDVMLAMEAVAIAARGVEAVVLVTGDEDLTQVLHRVGRFGTLTGLVYWNLPADDRNPRPTFTSGRLVSTAHLPMCLSDALNSDDQTVREEADVIFNPQRDEQPAR